MAFKNTFLPVETILKSKGRSLDISAPVVMGILNATPDSFYNKGAQSKTPELVYNAGLMLQEGAAILDIGGASTRPGAIAISVAEELERVIPAIESIKQRYPDCWVSIDTYHAATAIQAVGAGADIVNDVSGGNIDPDMIREVAKLGVPYIAMHMQGLPKTMQDNPSYRDVVREVFDFCKKVSDRCLDAGIEQVILDPGFGFGKTTEHNFTLLNHLGSMRELGRPILAGISRKSIVCKPLNVNPAQALNGTTALHMAALQQGASLLRVHDVKEAVQCIKLYACFSDIS